MANDTIKVRLILDDKDLEKAPKKAKDVGVRIGDAIGGGVKRAFSALGLQLAAVLGSAAAIKTVTKDFVEFERALAGVAKTTDITGSSLSTLGQQIQQLSTEIPVSANELLRLAQVAGQFGIRGTDNILKFTETIGKLQFAIEGIDPETAAQDLTRILNVTKQGVKDIDKLSSALVALGNNFEANEGEIITITNEVARASAAFGVNAQDALALGTALKAVGVQAESGGTAVGRVFQQISSAIAKGGKDLERFARITGRTTKQLEQDFGENAIEVFEDFIQGLSKTSGSSVALTKNLQDLGLSQQRVIKSIAPLVNSTDKLSQALSTAREEFGLNTALNKEFNRVNQTTQAQIVKFRNSITRLSTSLGTLLGPSLRANIKLLKELTDDFTNFINRSFAAGNIQKIAQLRFELNKQDEAISRARNLLFKYQQQLDSGESTPVLNSAIKQQEGLLQRASTEWARLNEELQKIQKPINDLAGKTPDVPTPKTTITPETDDQALIESATTTQSALGATLDRFREITAGTFQVFSDEIFANTQLTDKGLEQLNKAFNQKLAGGISSAVQTFVGALAAGENAFEALAKNILGLLGDLAIQVGTFLIATGISQLELLKSPGGPVIAAGVGLVALGTVLKAIGGSGFAGGTGGGAGAGGTVGGGTLEDTGVTQIDDDELLEPQTVVNVSIDGVVSDPSGVARQLQDLLADYSDSAGGFQVVEV